MTEPRILLYDLETAPLTGYTWQVYDTSVIKVIQDRYILSVAWKWLGESTTHVIGLTDFEKQWRKDSRNDIEILKVLHPLFQEANAVVAHNGNKFDHPITRGRFFLQGLEPNSFYYDLDTLRMVKQQFGFVSNRLDDIARWMGLGQKVKHTGFDMWEECLAGNPAAWKQMKKYNKHDVDLLEGVYLGVRPWVKSGPNWALISGNYEACPKCGKGTKLDRQNRGKRYTQVSIFQQQQCMLCTGYSSFRLGDNRGKGAPRPELTTTS